MTEQTQPESSPDALTPPTDTETSTSKPASFRLANIALGLGFYSAIGPLIFILEFNSSVYAPGVSTVGGIGFLMGPPAILLGVVSLVLIRLRPARHRGAARAAAGLLCGVAGIGWFVVVTKAHAANYGPWGTVIRSETRTKLERIGEVLRTWADDHGGEFPADLAEIHGIRSDTDGFLLVFHLSDVPDCTVTDFHYVSDLDRACPADWILAYADPSYFNDEGGGVLCVDGSVELLDEPAFSERIEAFGEAYEAARGEPPNVVAPH